MGAPVAVATAGRSVAGCFPSAPTSCACFFASPFFDAMSGTSCARDLLRASRLVTTRGWGAAAAAGAVWSREFVSSTIAPSFEAAGGFLGFFWSRRPDIVSALELLFSSVRGLRELQHPWRRRWHYHIYTSSRPSGYSGSAPSGLPVTEPDGECNGVRGQALRSRRNEVTSF